MTSVHPFDGRLVATKHFMVCWSSIRFVTRTDVRINTLVSFDSAVLQILLQLVANHSSLKVSKS